MVFFLLLLTVSASAQNAPEVVPIVTARVTPNLAMLMGAGGNVAVLTGNDGTVIVDDQFAPQAPLILAAAKALHDAPVRFVINTHFHGDHSGGNDAMGAVGALIVAHDNARARLSTEQFSKLMNEKLPRRADIALPVVTFSRNATLHWNGETIRLEHVANAHTDGDAVVWFESANVAHCGDTFFNGFYPFVDVESGGSIDGMIAAADVVLARANDETRIIPGHGPLATKADLANYRAMLVTLRERVAAAIAEGKTMEAFIETNPLADLEAQWGDGFLKSSDVASLVWMDLSAP